MEDGESLDLKPPELSETKPSIPDTKSGDEVSQMIARWYPNLPPRIACRLVESNNVLTFAGFKPETFFVIKDPTPSDEEELVKLNSMSEKDGVQFFPNPIQTDMGIQSISVYSLLGLERVTKITKIPGVPIFEAKSGFTGLEKWYKDIIERLKRSQEEEKIAKEIPVEEIANGLRLGYPDVAILDYVDLLSHGNFDKANKLTMYTDIPLANFYDSALPNYSFYPQHYTHPDITENTTLASDILKECYSSNQLKKITGKPEFKDERQKQGLLR